ncbi:RadC-like JAB domain-containing protein [Chitinophaga niastensis]|uniref:RadC-like JAB domain-containing protein n=1 Tax=Chitinophaga niastensis TaxID=536980 RepID=A0A2P8H996_CHINA|nr:JAB domain-containing protein [Chitinophaga niastensis]PSL42806.1 RadC-like JAB domain-containing protein [Chitinophaga niastensis]
MKNPDLKSAIAHLKVTFDPEIPRTERFKVRTIRDVYNLFLANWDETAIDSYEEAKVIYLDEEATVIGIFDLAMGSDSEVVFDIKVLAAIGVQTLAKAFVLAHNHPGAPIVPSFSDIATTYNVQAGCQLLNVHLLDHLIINKENYYSFREDGLLLQL